MDNAAPLEVIMAPFTFWVAPTGVTFPDVDVAPDSSDFTLVGTSGTRNYDEAGVTVQHAQAIAFWRSLGATGPQKARRTSEDLKIRLTLADLTLEQYALALEGNTITPTSAGVGTPGTKKIGLSRGQTVTQKALLIRGPSPYMADGIAQWEVPVAVQSGEPQITGKKNEPAGLALEWTAIEDPNASTEAERFGRFVAQTADATT